MRCAEWPVWAIAGLGVMLTVGAGAAQRLSTAEEVTTFVAGLEACRSSTAATPHPLMRSFIVEHTVTGPATGACGYTQTMPGKMRMVCALSESGRKALAAEIKNMAAGGSMRGSTRGPQPQWMQECEIETPDGKRMPAAPRSGAGG